MKKLQALLLLLVAIPNAWALPAVLVNSAHAAAQMLADFVILHPELNTPSGLSMFDDTCIGVSSGPTCASNVNFDNSIIADTQNPALQNANAANWVYPVNHAPYVLVNNSFSGYTLTGWGDLGTYATLQTYGVMMSWAFIAALPAATPPPNTSTTTMATSGPAALAGANWGLEFGMTNNYKGFDTSAPSWVTGAMTAVLAAMKVDHPDWNWFDIKGALRQTAAHWVGGWDPAQFGYGAIDYDAASSIASTAAVYLQPPILQAARTAAGLAVTLYPFRSSRRDHEVVYLVPRNYLFPMKNELTAADISTLVGKGGQLVFTGNTTDLLPAGTAVFAPQSAGPYTFVAFTTDGVGAYSRVESWSPQTVVLAGRPTPNQDAIHRELQTLLLPGVE